MKPRLHRTIALTLAGLLLFSSTGWSLNAHFCQDVLRGISLFGETESCHDAPPEAMSCCRLPVADAPKKLSCCSAPVESPEVQSDDCCSDKTIVLQSNLNFSVEVSEETSVDASDSFELISDRRQKNLPLITRIAPIPFDDPPPLRRLFVLVQSFLL